MSTRTFNGVRDVREILKWKRSGLIKSAPVRGLLRAFVANNLTHRPHGTGNRARRRRVALEVAREGRTL